MSLPPERISIKRRRQEEPVETVFLEPSVTHDKKRRFTDFVFQRLRNEPIAPVSTLAHSVQSPKAPIGDTSAIDYEALGIPTVKTTAPGDEVRDFANYKAVLKQRAREGEESTVGNTDDENGDYQLESSKSALGITPRRVLAARRFHLTSDLFSALKPNPVGGIRRKKFDIRPPLATFVERHHAQYWSETGSVHKSPPVDSIVHLKKDTAARAADAAAAEITPDDIERKTPVSTFMKSQPRTARLGHSINDDPSTWDLDSDQLANELAALALEMDPDAAPTSDDVSSPADQPAKTPADVVMATNNEEYVFETYVRVRRDAMSPTSVLSRDHEYGVLVIDEEVEELWERYIESDDDDDWDEEDADSNAEDNPRNDYPEDEVSTDDEYGNNVYKHRHNASDEEEFGEDGDGW